VTISSFLFFHAQVAVDMLHLKSKFYSVYTIRHFYHLLSCLSFPQYDFYWMLIGLENNYHFLTLEICLRIF